jgi:hypothetical protein
VAAVKLTSGDYQVTMTETEFALIKDALDEAERVSRFGIEVLAEVDTSQESERAEDSRLRREIDGLAMREMWLRALQKTLSEVDVDGNLAPGQHAELDPLSAAVDPRPR